MRAVTILNDYDSSKHSGIIAYFNLNYVKTGIFNKGLSKVIASASKLREKSDYVDFYIASKMEAYEQLVKADDFLGIIKNYLVEKQIIE